MIRELNSINLGRGEAAFTFLGYSGVILRVAGKVVAFDISRLLTNKELAELGRLDLSLYTHTHWDHYNPAAAKKILEETDATIVAGQEIINELEPPSNRLVTAEHGATLKIGDFEIDVVEGAHPRPINLYRIMVGEHKIFHGGDSGYVHVEQYPSDLAFLPTGTPSPSCSPENALKLVLDLQPKVAVAIHGSPRQMKKFKKLVEAEAPDIEVVIPEARKPAKVVM